MGFSVKNVGNGWATNASASGSFNGRFRNISKTVVHGVRSLVRVGFGSHPHHSGDIPGQVCLSFGIDSPDTGDMIYVFSASGSRTCKGLPLSQPGESAVFFCAHGFQTGPLNIFSIVL